MPSKPKPKRWDVLIGPSGLVRDGKPMSVISSHRTAKAARRELTGWIVTECEGMHQKPGREGRRIVLAALKEKHGVTSLSFLARDNDTGRLYARNELEA